MSEDTKPTYVYEAEAAKLNAEAAKARADAQMSELEGEANAERLRAETRRLDAETEHIVIERQKDELELLAEARKERSAQREEDEKDAKNENNGIYYFDSNVDGSSVRTLMRQIDIWEHLTRKMGVSPKERPISIIFSSPGGSIIDGFILYDYLQKVKRDGYPLSTGTYGMAASMAGILLQAGDVRWMGREAWVLIHEASFMAGGKIGEIQDTTVWISRIQKRILDVFATRALAVLEARDPEKVNRKFQVESHTKDDESFEVTLNNKEDIIKFIARSWKRKDWWIPSEEALAYGIVDEVR